MKIKHFIFILLGLCIALASCRRGPEQRQRQLLETIPARVHSVVCLDADALLKSAACRSTGGSIELTPQISELMQMADSAIVPLVRTVAGCGNIADLRQVVIMVDTAGIMVTAKLRADFMQQRAEAEEEGPPSYESPLLGRIEILHLPDSVCMAMSEDQAWWTINCPVPMPQAIDLIVKAADYDPLTSHPEIVDFLSLSAAQAKAIIHVDMTKNPLGEPFDAIYAELRLSDRSLSLSAWAMANGKKAAALGTVPEIDPQALMEMPPGLMAYAAVGVNDVLPHVIKQASEKWSLATRIGVGAVIDVMHTEGGTIALGIAPGGSAETLRRMDLASWLVRAVIPVDPEKGYDAAELVNFLSAGTLYSRADSVYLEVASYDLDAFEITSQGDIYGTPKAVAYASMPYNHQAMKALGLRNGYTLDVYATDFEATAVLAVHGPASYILPALISDAIILKHRFAPKK